MKNFNTSKNNRRVCKCCNNAKPIKEFASAGIVKGIQYYRSSCKPCYYAQKQAELKLSIAEFKKWKSQQECVRCGYSKKTNFEFVVEHLEFHHHKTNKLFNIADMVRSGHRLKGKRLQKELNKCVVMCGRCHTYTHYAHRNK
jgi:hypothetical protein